MLLSLVADDEVEVLDLTLVVELEEFSLSSSLSGPRTQITSSLHFSIID